MSRLSLQLQALSENLSFDSSLTSLDDTSLGTTSFDIDLYHSDTRKSKSPVTSDPLCLSLRSTISSETNLDGLNSSLYGLDRANVVPNIFVDDGAASIFHFQRGVEEARRFFPAINPMVIHFDDKYPFDLDPGELNNGSDEKDYLTYSCRGVKHYRAGENGIEEETEGRNKKQSAIYEEDDLSEVFDKVLLCNDDNNDDDSPSVNGKQSQKGRNGRKSRSNKQGESCEILDPHSLLMSCAEFVVAADYGAAVQQLMKIRRYSSPSGVANQRVAHAFANGLEARLAGIGVQLCASSSLHKINRFPSYACEMMKSHMSSSLPFMRLFVFFVNKMIYQVALKATSLHVIDFGILHGVQWPTLIRDLSRRHGDPPKLRITGIELPQSGFRPSQIIVDTGCHLARYCKRFNVPFEFNAITAKNWEALKIDDLKLKRGEVIAVNCLDRFKGILDDTTSGADSPRDVVLKLIHEVSPHIFVNTVGSAPRNSPFFVNRFKSALYTYSGAFDMHDSIFSQHDSQMLNFEQAIMGPVITNIIACEGVERIERPETYKQWHSRTLRAGFKPMPLNLELVKQLRVKAWEANHKDFMFAEDGHWVLQGWKGQVFSGSSAWVTHNR